MADSERQRVLDEATIAKQRHILNTYSEELIRGSIFSFKTLSSYFFPPYDDERVELGNFDEIAHFAPPRFLATLHGTKNFLSDVRDLFDTTEGRIPVASKSKFAKLTQEIGLFIKAGLYDGGEDDPFELAGRIVKLQAELGGEFIKAKALPESQWERI